MIYNLFLCCSVLLLSCSHLLAHPVTDTAYSGPDSVEEAGVISPDDFSVSDLNDLLQRAAVVGYSPLLSRESAKMSGQIPKDTLREKNRIASSLPADCGGGRRRFRKRGNSADCFWKYCV